VCISHVSLIPGVVHALCMSVRPLSMSVGGWSMSVGGWCMSVGGWCMSRVSQACGMCVV